VNVQDKWLVWRFRRGDCEAVRVIYEKHKRELLALAGALLRNSAAAEDVVQDVFVSFLRQTQFRLTGSLRGYLATCVANRARNTLRDNLRHRAELLEDAPPLSAQGPAPDGAAMFDEESRILAQAVGELPYEQREVVLLRLQGGLKFSEIARSQDVSVNTVLGRYRYALEKLRTQLNGKLSHATQ
jgi:RNA polymerase sigma-70 factor (ECF subfamily)